MSKYVSISKCQQDTSTEAFPGNCNSMLFPPERHLSVCSRIFLSGTSHTISQNLRDEELKINTINNLIFSQASPWGRVVVVVVVLSYLSVVSFTV